MAPPRKVKKNPSQDPENQQNEKNNETTLVVHPEGNAALDEVAKLEAIKRTQATNLNPHTEQPESSIRNDTEGATEKQLASALKEL